MRPLLILALTCLCALPWTACRRGPESSPPTPILKDKTKIVVNKWEETPLGWIQVSDTLSLFEDGERFLMELSRAEAESIMARRNHED